MKQVTAKQASKDTTHHRYWHSRITGEYLEIKSIHKWGANVMVNLVTADKGYTDEFVTDPSTPVFIGKLKKGES